MHRTAQWLLGWKGMMQNSGGGAVWKRGGGGGNTCVVLSHQYIDYLDISGWCFHQRAVIHIHENCKSNSGDACVE